MPELIYLIIDGRILFYIGIGRRDISLRLVIIIIGHKILHRVFRKKLLEFTVELCCKSFVMGDDEGRTSKLLYDVRHGKCLTGAGGAKERLKLVAGPEPVHKLFYRLGLIARRLIFGM